METKTPGQFDARYSDFSSNSHLNSLKNNTPKFSLRMPVSNSSPCEYYCGDEDDSPENNVNVIKCSPSRRHS